MQGRITAEPVDPTGEEYRREFQLEKTLDGLTDGRIGCSIGDGKEIMAEIQKAVVHQEPNHRARCRRVCQCCGGQLPIKDNQKRNILTVYSAVPVTCRRLLICQRCTPGHQTATGPSRKFFPPDIRQCAP